MYNFHLYEGAAQAAISHHFSILATVFTLCTLATVITLITVFTEITLTTAVQEQRRLKV